MNANELAVYLEDITDSEESPYRQAATMLRQQQTELDAFKLNYYNTGYSLQLRDKDETIRQQAQEIAMLKQIIDANNLQSDIGQLKKELALQKLSDIGQEIEHQLTDEEIESAYWSLVGKQHEGKIASYLYNFAKAILKKASDK